MHVPDLARQLGALAGKPAHSGEIVLEEGRGGELPERSRFEADVAQLAGSSRESASRFLAVLERAGVISQGRGKFTVHDPSALEGYVF